MLSHNGVVREDDVVVHGGVGAPGRSGCRGIGRGSGIGGDATGELALETFGHHGQFE